MLTGYCRLAGGVQRLRLVCFAPPVANASEFENGPRGNHFRVQYLAIHRLS